MSSVEGDEEKPVQPQALNFTPRNLEELGVTVDGIKKLSQFRKANLLTVSAFFKL